MALDVATRLGIGVVLAWAALPWLAKLARRHGLDQLSMGMSADFETGVMIGATHVRVGTALFGSRA